MTGSVEKTLASLVLSRRISSGNEVFSSIQNKMRTSSIGTKRVMKILAGYADDKIHMISIAKLSEIMHSEMLIDLVQIESDYIVKRFCLLLYPGYVDLNKFMHAVDISKPLNHIDPDYFEDDLPQPYRLISKIIDLEIIDRAWVEITRIHPDYLVGSDGEALFVPKNQRLQCIHTPTAQITTNVISMISIPSSGFIVTANVDGVISLKESQTEKTFGSLMVFAPPSNDDKIQSNDCIAGLMQLSPPKLCAVSALSSDEVCRVVIICKVEHSASVPVSTTSKSNLKKGSEPPVAETVLSVHKYCFWIIQASLRQIKMSSMNSNQLRITNKILLDAKEEDHIDDVSCDLSLDGSLLCIATPNGCKIYDTGVMTVDVEQIMSDISEDHELDVMDTESVVELIPVLDLGNEYSKKAGKGLLGAALFPLLRPSGTYASPSNSKSFADTAVLLIFESFRCWSIIGLQYTYTNSETLSQKLFSPIVIGNWKLLSQATSYHLSCDKTLMALGCQDGSVSLWNLASRSLSCFVAKHEYPVTSLCFCFNAFKQQQFLVSGALDGTLCFCQISVSSLYTVDSSPTMLAGIPYITAELVEFSHDVPNVYVSKILAMVDVPVLVVCYSNGIIAAYDCTGMLLTQLSLLRGMEAQHFFSRPLTSIDSQRLVGSSIGLPADPTDFDVMTPSNRTRKGQICQNPITNIKYHQIICLVSRANFMCMFIKDGKPVLASFDQFNLIVACYPGIASLNPAVSRTNLPDLLRALKVTDLMNAQLDLNAYPALSHINDYNSAIIVDKTDSRNHNRKSSSTNGQCTNLKLTQEVLSFHMSKSHDNFIIDVPTKIKDASLWDKMLSPHAIAVVSVSQMNVGNNNGRTGGNAKKNREKKVLRIMDDMKSFLQVTK